MAGVRKPIAFNVTVSGCHICTSHKVNTHGYPSLWKDGKPQNMHRVLYEEAHGPQGDLLIRHTCDNRLCINLSHLIPGTHVDNMADRNARNRHNPPKGERAGNTTLTEADVAAIRSSSDTQRTLADRYGLTQPQISRIKSGKRWAHSRAP